jgi:hypothetical protein
MQDCKTVRHDSHASAQESNNAQNSSHLQRHLQADEVVLCPL